MQYVLELRGPEDEQAHWRRRNDGGTARAMIDERDLSEKVAHAHVSDDLARPRHVGGAAHHHEELAAARAFLAEDLSTRHVDILDTSDNECKLLLGASAEEMDPAQEVDAGVLCHGG